MMNKSKYIALFNTLGGKQVWDNPVETAQILILNNNTNTNNLPPHPECGGKRKIY